MEMCLEKRDGNAYTPDKKKDRKNWKGGIRLLSKIGYAPVLHDYTVL